MSGIDGAAVAGFPENERGLNPARRARLVVWRGRSRPMRNVTRRTAIKTAGLAAAGLALGGFPFSAMAKKGERKRSLRLAHLTDTHIQPEKNADAGVADLVMDCFEADDARTKQQWDLFTKVFKDECSIPLDGCLGNHDIWGINKTKSKTTGTEPGWGKKRAMDLLKMSKPYRSFDRNGWHFIMLDSVTPQGEGYIGKLDDEQWEWLEGDLKATKLPVLVLSHIPILAATQLVIKPSKDTGKREISDGLMMTDAPRFVETFAKHPNVKVCLSGHIHQLDRVDFQGVSYLCNGAVSGNWWKGRYKMCDEGYALVDLFDDGTFENRYVPFGWKAEGT
jgi:Icc protein